MPRTELGSRYTPLPPPCACWAHRNFPDPLRNERCLYFPSSSAANSDSSGPELIGFARSDSPQYPQDRSGSKPESGKILYSHCSHDAYSLYLSHTSLCARFSLFLLWVDLCTGVFIHDEVPTKRKLLNLLNMFVFHRGLARIFHAETPTINAMKDKQR